MINNLESYSAFAPFYRSLIKHRSHAGPIARLLAELLTPSHRKLLDAACGQGNDVYFDELPYRVFYGADGSHEMIGQLLGDSALAARYEAIDECLWKDLASIFHRHGKFDAVFFWGTRFLISKVSRRPKRSLPIATTG